MWALKYCFALQNIKGNYAYWIQNLFYSLNLNTIDKNVGKWVKIEMYTEQVHRTTAQCVKSLYIYYPPPSLHT